MGQLPRCGNQVIQGHRGYGCSAWKDGCKFVLWPTYKDRELEAREIRELLQHGVLQRPIELAGVGQVILSLSESGALNDIPVPQKEPHSGSTERDVRTGTEHQRESHGGPEGARKPTRNRTRTADHPPDLATVPCAERKFGSSRNPTAAAVGRRDVSS